MEDSRSDPQRHQPSEVPHQPQILCLQPLHGALPQTADSRIYTRQSSGSSQNGNGQSPHGVVQQSQPRPQRKNEPYNRSNSTGSYQGNNGGYGLPVYGNTNYGQDTSKVNTNDPKEIDSALLAALRDLKERVALLKLEGALGEFMNSDAGWIEVGGPYNSMVWSPAQSQAQQEQLTLNNINGARQSSFQRCVLHRLADRFGIVREPGNLLGAGSLRLIKLPHSKVPELKMADFWEAQEKLGEDDDEGVNAAPGLAVEQPPRTMKIMKRNSAHPKLQPNQKTIARKPSVTDLEEKERAYAAARARIFNQEHDGGQSSAPSNPLEPSQMFQEGNGTYTEENRTDSNTSAQKNDAYSHGQQQPISLNENKAVYRNRTQEEADPDFRRNSLSRPSIPMMYPMHQQPGWPQPHPGSSFAPSALNHHHHHHHGQQQQQQFQIHQQYHAAQQQYFAATAAAAYSQHHRQHETSPYRAAAAAVATSSPQNAGGKLKLKAAAPAFVPGGVSSRSKTSEPS